MNTFQKQCVEYLAKFVERNVLGDAGQRVKEFIRRDRLITSSRTPSVALAMALVAEPGWGDHQDPERIRALAADLMDLWADKHIEIVRADGVTFSFPLICYGPAYRLLEPFATAAQRRHWRRALRMSARGAERFLVQKKDSWGKPGPWTGCGPNHLFMTAASLYRFGKILGEQRLWRLARRAARKLCELQAPEGYFPESSGPVVGYHQLSLYGLCDYYAASGDVAVLPFIERGIRFVVRASWPDLTPIAALDQRHRSHRRPGHVGGGGGGYGLSFSFTPAGRRYAQLMLDRYTAHVPEEPSPQACYASGLAAMAALLHPGGRAAGRLSCERDAYTDRLDGVAGIIRRDGWCVVLAGYHESRRPGNPYILDRTQNIAVFQDRCGLVIGGGNDKNHFDAATFEVLESGTCYYFPPVAERAHIRRREGVLDLDFGAAKARLTARVVSRRRVELVAGLVTNFGEQRNRFNLQVPVGPGAKLQIDGALVMLRPRKTQKTWPVSRSLELPGLVRVDVPCPAAFCWPHLPWDTYNHPTHKSPISGAVGFLRIPLSGKNATERKVRVHLVG